MMKILTGVAAILACVAGCAAETADEDAGESEQGVARRAPTPDFGAAAFNLPNAMLPADFIAVDSAETASVPGPGASTQPNTTSGNGAPEWYVIATVVASSGNAYAYHLEPLAKFIPGATPGTGTFARSVGLSGNQSVPEDHAPHLNGGVAGGPRFWRIRRGTAAAQIDDATWSARLDALSSALLCARPDHGYHFIRIGNGWRDRAKVSRWFVGYDIKASALGNFNGNSNTFAAYALRSAGYDGGTPGAVLAPGFELVRRYATTQQLSMDGTTGKIATDVATVPKFEFLAYAKANPADYPATRSGLAYPVQFSPPMQCASVRASIPNGPTSIECAPAGPFGGGPVCGPH